MKDVQEQMHLAAEEADQLMEVKNLARMVSTFYHDLRAAKLSKADSVYLTSEFITATMTTCEEGHSQTYE